MLAEAGEVIYLHSILDKVVAFSFAFYQLEKSGAYNDMEASVFEVLLYDASCSECLKASKASNFPLSCDELCRDCFTNKSVCNNQADLYDS